MALLIALVADTWSNAETGWHIESNTGTHTHTHTQVSFDSIELPMAILS